MKAARVRNPSPGDVPGRHPRMAACARAAAVTAGSFPVGGSAPDSFRMETSVPTMVASRWTGQVDNRVVDFFPTFWLLWYECSISVKVVPSSCAP